MATESLRDRAIQSCTIVRQKNGFTGAYNQEIAENVYTSYGVVNEIRDSATRQRLAVLSYDLKCREPSTEAIQIDFARKTGDYSSLSAVDLRVLALAYQVTKEQLGEEAFKKGDRSAPDSGAKEQTFGQATKIVGFVYPKDTANNENQPDKAKQQSREDPSNEEELTEKLNQLNTTDTTSSSTTTTQASDGSVELTLTKLDDQPSDKTSKEQLQTSTDTQTESKPETNSSSEEATSESRTCDDHTESVGDENVKQSDQDAERKGDGEEEEEVEEDEDDDEDEGWITPSNLREVQKDMGGVDEEPDDIVVGCMTTDFAMQNVLIQMGIPVLSLEGMRIRRAKSYILRCYGCFKTTTNMNKKFCPGCGNASLSKVSVSIDENTGKQNMYFSKRKVINTRGMKYSLPAPKGGKHADNPFLAADQPVPQNHLPRKARQGTDVFNADFVSNASPFAMKDVTSRSAQLGVGYLSSNAGRNRRNPNEANRKRKGKKR